MCLEQALDGQAIAVTDCGPIDEIAFADGADFDDLAKTALNDFVQAALAVTPKKRSKSQRDAVSLLKSLDQLPGPDLHTGPAPVGAGDNAAVVTAQPASSAVSIFSGCRSRSNQGQDGKMQPLIRLIRSWAFSS